MKVAFHTLGCKVNHYETEAIKEAFVSRGAESVGEEEFADVYIINTCTVTNIADRKSRQFIRRAKRMNPDALIVVTGCYAQVASEEVAAMPEVDLIVGNGRKSEICGLVMEKLASDRSDTAKQDDAEVMIFPREKLTFYEDMGHITSGSEGMTRAYIKIQDGCDRFCSYCLIPFARGPVRSRPAEDIVEEVKALTGSGYREIVLTGINTALYGTEDGAEHSLSDLLSMLDDLEVPNDFRVRLSSLEPTVVDKDNVGEIIRHRRLCNHLHLSVQAGSDSVLKAMNRHYTRAEYLDIVKSLRDYDPQFGITTDIIVGFPGETDDDFNDSLRIVKETGFGKTHVFRYSPRRGTVGARLQDAVPGEIKRMRAEALEKAGEEAARAFIEANCNMRHTVLVEEINEGIAEGYTANYIKTYINCGSPDHSAQVPEQELQTAEARERRIVPGMLVDVILTEPFRDGARAENGIIENNEKKI